MFTIYSFEGLSSGLETCAESQTLIFSFFTFFKQYFTTELYLNKLYFNTHTSVKNPLKIAKINSKKENNFCTSFNAQGWAVSPNIHRSGNRRKGAGNLNVCPANGFTPFVRAFCGIVSFLCS